MLTARFASFAFAAALLFATNASQAQTPTQLLDDFFKAAAKVQTFSFILKKEERINGQMRTGVSDIKAQREPYKVYLYSRTPATKGLEILFVKGWNGNNALINPNGFPYVNVSFSPYSERLRENNHYTLNDIGYDYMVRQLRHTVQVYGKNTAQLFKNEGMVMFNGATCYKLVMTDPKFHWETYSVPKNISLNSLALGQYVSAHMVKEKNGLSSFGTLKEGTNILMPSSFAQKLVMYLDKQTMLPVLQEVYDEKGLYERYEYQNTVINPTFDAAEFTRECARYHFQ